jgi:2-hydroxymuconate-semialdehyde hydrolase
MNDTNADPEIGLFVNAGGVRTNFHDQGQGTPILLLHGSGPGVTAWANWRLNMPAFARSFRVIAPDLPGFGYTEWPAAIPLTLDAWTEHVRAFLDVLGVRRVHIIGNSFGGALALRLAARHRDYVDRLVFMGSVGTSFPITPGLEKVWGYEPSYENMRALLGFFAYDPSLVGEHVITSRLSASMRAGAQEQFAALFPAPRQRWIEALATPESEIAAIDAPALVIHGRGDRVIPLAASERLYSLLPNADLHVFARCGHWTQIEHAKRFNEMVIAFLEAS